MMAHMTNPLASPEQLYGRNTLSSLPTDLLDVIFFSTQCLTQAAGLLLQLPQSITAQASVLLARYWLVEPPMAHEFSDVSAASLYLVAKMSPFPCSPRNIANVYSYLLSPSSPLFRGGTPENEPSSYILSETAYEAARTRMLALETRVLFALGFDAHVALPHWLAVTYLQALDFLDTKTSNNSNGRNGDEQDKSAALSRRALAYLNTALLSPQLLYLTHQPPALAVAAVYAAARDCGARMPPCEWWEVFDVDREELGFLVVGMRSVDGWWATATARSHGPGGEGEDGAAAETPVLRSLGHGGAVTRGAVQEELVRRGLSPGAGLNGGGHKGDEADEEAEVMRKMDERMAEMEKKADA